MNPAPRPTAPIGLVRARIALAPLVLLAACAPRPTTPPVSLFAPPGVTPNANVLRFDPAAR